jgi:hypothetical protein
MAGVVARELVGIYRSVVNETQLRNAFLGGRA